MEYYRQEIKAGVLVIVSFLVLCFFLFHVAGIQRGAEYDEYVISFSDIGGLMVNAPVRYAGVDAGHVSWIRIVQGGRSVVDVGVAVERDVPLRPDCTVTVSSSGFIGEKYVSISPGSESQPRLEAGARLQGVEPADMGTIMARMNTVLKELEGKDLGAEMTEIIADARTTMINARESSEHIKELVVEIHENGRIRHLMNDAAKLVVKVQAIADRIDRILAENQKGLGNTVANIEELSDELRRDAAKILTELRQILERVDELVADNQGNLDATIHNARDFTEVIKRQPWRLIRKGNTDKYFQKRDEARAVEETGEVGGGN